VNRADVLKAAKVIGPWIPATLLLLIFVPQGWSKFSDTSGWSQAFRTWGYPDWFRIGVGVAELFGCALLVTGRGAAMGALLIAGVMVGGTATHVVLDQGRHVTSEIVPIVLAMIVVVVRRQQLLDLATALKLGRTSAVIALVAFIGVAVMTPVFLPDRPDRIERGQVRP
jgi:putative oxidoreductase